MTNPPRPARGLSRRAISNQRNALKSTGPQTPAGKLRSSANALRHGYNTPPSASSTLKHLRLILSDPEADVASSLRTEVGQAAFALAIAEASLDRILEDRSALQFIDKDHEMEAAFMFEALPPHRSRNKEETWMKEAITFLLKQKHRSRKMFKTQITQYDRYLAHAHATRRKALMRYLAEVSKNLQNEAK